MATESLDPRWNYELLPLEGLLDVARLAIMAANPYGSGVAGDEFTIIDAQIKRNKQETVQTATRLVADGNSMRYGTYAKIGRRTVSLDEANARYQEIVQQVTETEGSFWRLEFWDCKARKSVWSGDMHTAIELSFGLRFSNANPIFKAELALIRAITPKLRVVQSVKGLSTTRYGRDVEELQIETEPVIQWGYKKIDLPNNWQQLMQEKFGPDLSFADLDVDTFWDLLEWDLQQSDIIEGGEEFLTDLGLKLT
jgi:hypothetical protein